MADKGYRSQNVFENVCRRHSFDYAHTKKHEEFIDVFTRQNSIEEKGTNRDGQ